MTRWFGAALPCLLLSQLVLGHEDDQSREVLTCNIMEFGAVPGETNNAASIQSAIDSCSAQAAGDRFVVDIPAGTFVTGTIVLASNMKLRLSKGAVLAGSTDPRDYPLLPPLPSYGIGRDDAKDLTKRYAPIIYGINVSGVEIEGTGMGEGDALIDGRGATWWERFYNKSLEYSRPRTIELMYSKDLVIRKLRIHNPPFWNVHLYASENVLVEYLNISAPVFQAPNTDGIDVDSVANATIRYSEITTGDDAIAIKSGLNQPGVDFGRPSRDIHIHDVWARARNVAVGSEMSGGVYNVLIENVIVNDANPFNVWHGMNVKTRAERGGFVENVTFRNCRTVPHGGRTIHWPMLAVDMFYGQNAPHPDMYKPAKKLPVVRNVTFENITLSGVKQVGIVAGLRDSLATMVRFVNIVAEDYDTGIVCSNSTDVSIINTSVPAEGCDGGRTERGSGRAKPLPILTFV